MVTKDVELGHLARPDGPGPWPAVVMIHDVWGVSDHTRDLARRLAACGFVVLAVDLYRRLDSVDIDDAGAWIRELSDPQVLADVQAAVDQLAADAEPAAARVAVTGFCMGGMYALMAACACRGLAASVPFYGMLSHRHGLLYNAEGLDPARKPREPLEMARELGCPTLAFFGAQDPFIPLPDVELLRARMAESGQLHDVVVYEGAGHAFMNDTRPDAFRPAIAEQAWTRMLAFLREQLHARVRPADE